MRYYTPKRVLSYLLSNCFIFYALLNRREKRSKKRGDLWLLLHNARSRRISSWDVNLSQNVPKRYKTTFIVKFYFRSLFSNPLRNSYPILLLFAGVFSLRERHGCFVFFFFASATKKRLSDEVKDELSKPKQKVEANNTVTMFDNSW